MSENEASDLFVNRYICPECGHLWDELYEALPDDDCPRCRTRHVSPYLSRPVYVPDSDLSPLVVESRSGKTLECGAPRQGWVSDSRPESQSSNDGVGGIQRMDDGSGEAARGWPWTGGS